MTTATPSRRTSNGLRVTALEPPPGPMYAAATDETRLVVHAGRPVFARCTCAGRQHVGLTRRGDIDLLPAGIDGTWEDDRPTTVVVLSLSAALMASAADRLGRPPVALAPRFRLRDPQVEHLAWALEAELATPREHDWPYGDALASALATHLVRRHGTTPARRPAAALTVAQVREVTDYVEAHLAEPLAIAALAARAGVGASRFKALFARALGRPVHRYVVERRVARAHALLREGVPVADVAARTGFSDASHLARWTRRLLGTTPARLGAPR